MRPVSVLFFVTEDWYFRSHRFDLAMYLKRNGFMVAVGTRINEDPANTRRETDIEFFSVPFRRSLKNPLLDILASMMVVWSIFRRRPDVVHLIALKPILASGLAVIAFPRVQFVHAISGMGYLFASDERRAKLVRSVAMRLLKVIFTRPNSHVLVQNSDDRKLIKDLGWVPDHRIRLIPGSGVDTEQFFVAESVGAIAHTPVVILPARMIRDKGVYEFIEAATIISARGVRAMFALVGGVDPDNPSAILRSDLERLTAEAGVEWWGHQSDMIPVYQRADIVCLPSYREGLPKCLLEAAACGRPLVATDVAGCRDVCRHDETGLLVSPRDSEALADALMQMIKDKTLRDRCGSEARRLVETKFSLDLIAEQTIDYYQHVIESVAG